MSRRKVVSIWLLVLAIVMCTAGEWPTVKYKTTWDPPKLRWGGRASANPVYQYRGVGGLLGGFGPDQFPESGCYVAGACADASRHPEGRPTRLHISHLTDSQMSQARVVRFIVKFIARVLLALNLLGVGLCLMETIRYARRQGLIRGLMVIVPPFLIGLLLLCHLLLWYGPIEPLVEPAPLVESDCATTKPIVECTGSPDITHSIGVVHWELEGGLHTIPILVGFSLISFIAAIALWFSGEKHRYKNGSGPVQGEAAT